MKNLIKKTGIIFGLLLLIGQFISCDTTSSKNKDMASINNTTISKSVAIEARKPIVFITGIDKGDNKFYNSARAYFIEKQYQIVEGAYSIEEIINWLNRNATKSPYGEINIVSHSNPWRGMSLETVVKGKRVTAESLRESVAKKELPTLKNVINRNTKIVFHSCGLGENTELMNALKEVFVTNETPKIIASPYYNVFGGEFSNHYLAKSYYVFYPTAKSPGKVDLSKEISRKYPEETEIDWFTALNNDTERYVGEPYYFQFNVPVKWEFDYHNTDDEIPSFNIQEEVMDWIADNEDLSKELSKLNIPLEKFRWNWKIKNSFLIIEGKTTVLCVLKPLTKPYGDLEHIAPDTNNKRLYAMK